MTPTQAIVKYRTLQRETYTEYTDKASQQRNAYDQLIHEFENYWKCNKVEFKRILKRAILAFEDETCLDHSPYMKQALVNSIPDIKAVIKELGKRGN